MSEDDVLRDVEPVAGGVGIYPLRILAVTTFGTVGDLGNAVF